MTHKIISKEVLSNFNNILFIQIYHNNFHRTAFVCEQEFYTLPRISVYVCIYIYILVERFFLLVGLRVASTRYLMSLLHAPQILHGVEHKYHSHCVRVITGRLFGRRRRIAKGATTVAVDRVRVLAHLSAILGVRFDDAVVVHPAFGVDVGLK